MVVTVVQEAIAGRAVERGFDGSELCLFCDFYLCLSFSYHLDTHIAILYIYYDHILARTMHIAKLMHQASCIHM